MFYNPRPRGGLKVVIQLQVASYLQKQNIAHLKPRCKLRRFDLSGHFLYYNNHL